MALQRAAQALVTLPIARPEETMLNVGVRAAAEGAAAHEPLP
jgi:hypothetical protein